MRVNALARISLPNSQMTVAASDFVSNSSSGPREQRAWVFMFAAWLAATVSTSGALFLSEVVGVPPCVLCWYQRIFMFPLVLVLGMALFPFDRRAVRYAVPLVAAGWGIALFHVLLTIGVVPETATPCVQGIPCSRIDIQWFGFLTIPLLSLLSFSVIAMTLVAAHWSSRS